MSYVDHHQPSVHAYMWINNNQCKWYSIDQRAPPPSLSFWCPAAIKLAVAPVMTFCHCIGPPTHARMLIGYLVCVCVCGQECVHVVLLQRWIREPQQEVEYIDPSFVLKYLICLLDRSTCLVVSLTEMSKNVLWCGMTEDTRHAYGSE